MPLHVWLPGAHANAPSHVSAVMSGVMLKMGIYGMRARVRPAADARPSGGAVRCSRSARSPACSASPSPSPARPQAAARLQQHREHRHHRDGPRPRAARPLARARRTGGRSGSAGALLHVLEPRPLQVAALPRRRRRPPRHAARAQIDRPRRPGQPMPWTSRSSALGAVAICGLPPLNGFVSELAALPRPVARRRRRRRAGHLGLRRPRRARAGPDRRAGRRLLRQGVRRSSFGGRRAQPGRRRAHDPGRAMLAPMARARGRLRAARPRFRAPPRPLLRRAVAAWEPALALAEPSLAALAPARLGRRRRARPARAWSRSLARARRARGGAGAPTALTWDCGYAGPDARGCSTPAPPSPRRSSASSPGRVRPRRAPPELTRPLPARRRASRARCRTPCSTGSSCRSSPALDRAPAAAARAPAGPRARVPALHPARRRAPCCMVGLRRRRAEACMSDARRSRPRRAPALPAAAPARRDQQDQGVVRRPRGPPLLQPYYDLAQALPQGAGAQPHDDLDLPRRAGRDAGAARCWPALLVPLGALRRADRLRRRPDPVRLPLRRWGASSPPPRRSTPARPSRAWARRARSTFACLSEPALFFALLVLAALLGLAHPDARCCTRPLRARSRACRPRRWSWSPSASSSCCWPRPAASRSTIPNTHLELTMIHEVMVLDHSGPLLGLILYGAALKLFVLSALLLHVVLPVALGQPWLDWLALRRRRMLALAVGHRRRRVGDGAAADAPRAVPADRAAVLCGFGFVLLAA